MVGSRWVFRVSRGLVLLAVVSMVASGCLWTSFRHGPDRTGSSGDTIINTTNLCARLRPEIGAAQQRPMGSRWFVDETCAQENQAAPTSNRGASSRGSGAVTRPSISLKRSR
jgi:hypothetical protein